MMNDRPVKEIAEIIFAMHSAKKEAKDPVQVKKELDEIWFKDLLTAINEEDYIFDTPFCDKQYFPMLRD